MLEKFLVAISVTFLLRLALKFQTIAFLNIGTIYL